MIPVYIYALEEADDTRAREVNPISELDLLDYNF